jgi:hypothetical protein
MNNNKETSNNIEPFSKIPRQNTISVDELQQQPNGVAVPPPNRNSKNLFLTLKSHLVFT